MTMAMAMGMGMAMMITARARTSLPPLALGRAPRHNPGPVTTITRRLTTTPRRRIRLTPLRLTPITCMHICMHIIRVRQRHLLTTAAPRGIQAATPTRTATLTITRRILQAIGSVNRSSCSSCLRGPLPMRRSSMRCTAVTSRRSSATIGITFITAAVAVAGALLRQHRRGVASPSPPPAPSPLSLTGAYTHASAYHSHAALAARNAQVQHFFHATGPSVGGGAGGHALWPEYGTPTAAAHRLALSTAAVTGHFHPHALAHGSGDY